MDGKLYIKKFIRDDGETLSLNAEELYLAEKNTLLVRTNPATTAVEYTEADGGEMIRQRGATYAQTINGLIVPKTMDYWTLQAKLSRFFILNHTYKIVYIKKDGSMFMVSNAWISSGLQIIPMPHEDYALWNIELTIGNIFWTEYSEDAQGKETYTNSVILPLLTASTGGEVWDDDDPQYLTGAGTDFTINHTTISAIITGIQLKGNMAQQTAPAPDSPQPVEVVKGTQVVSVHDRNILNVPASYTLSGYRSVSISAKRGRTYTVQCNSITTDGSGSCLLTFQKAGGGTVGSIQYLSNTTKEKTVTLTADAVAIYIYSDTGYATSQGVTTTFYDLMVCESSERQAYVPYQTQSYSIDLGSTELCKIGSYQDYIYLSGSDWYVHKEIEKVVLEGSYGGYNGGANWFWVGLNSYSKPSTIAGASLFCDRFAYYQHSPFASDQTLNGCSVDSATVLIIRNTACSSTAEYKTWLSSNNVTIYYPLATATDTKITDSNLITQLDALANAQTYLGETDYLTSGSDLPVVLDIELFQQTGGGEYWNHVGTVWEEGAGGVQTINVDSTQTIYPVWTVTGPCVNPTIQNDTTDSVASFGGTVAAGQTLTVNFEDNTAYLDSAPVAKYVSGYVSLAPGENTVGFNSDGGSAETSTLSWNNIIN